MVGSIGVSGAWVVVEFGKWDDIYKHSTKSHVWSLVHEGPVAKTEK